MTSGSAEIAAYAESIADRFSRTDALVRSLIPVQLNWRPPTDGGNSVHALAAHAAGNARAWIVGIACGNDIRRDRPGEFASAGDPDELLRHLRAIADDVAQALASLDPARLDVRLTPSQELWGEGAAHEISVRYAIVHVIEHASLHLGHMQLTADLARRV